MAPTKKRLCDMDVDEFFNADSDDESETTSTKFDKSKRRKKSKILSQSNVKGVHSGAALVSGNTLANHSKSSGRTKALQQSEKTKRKPTLKSKQNSSNVKMKGDLKHSMASALKENDPEFYDFLKGQDKGLLDNLEDLSNSDDESSEDDGDVKKAESSSRKTKGESAFEKNLLNMSSGEDTDSDDGEDGTHKPPEKLEVASDDSEDEGDETPETTGFRRKGGILLTHKMIDKWAEQIARQPSRLVFREIVSAFHAAVHEAGTEETEALKYRVEGSDVFNGVVRLCLTQVAPAIQALLKLPALSEVHEITSNKSPAWNKLKLQVKSYISDLLKLLANLSEAAMINALLKHIHKLVAFYASFPKLTRLFIKRMIKIWTTGEETTRVLAFLCINKIVRLRQGELLEPCLKQMYVAYVSNCKFTSPATLPLINFMQRSMIEIISIDQTLAYQYAFVYLRQLAIHLRNAISVTKKDTCQTVYNWQYIHCLGLWVQLLCVTYPSDSLQPLLYPLTQTIIGTIKLLPTARYYPLRLHCVRLLNQLSSKTNTFIPTLPFLLEIFEQTDFNKRHKNISHKPFNFAVILKFSKAQLGEKAFKDGMIDQLYEYLLESFNIQAHSIGFPEFIIPAVLQLKSFLKRCKIANYCKQIKQIVDKIQEQSKFIVDKRRHTSISLNDSLALSQWESQLVDSGTPLRKYYTSWRKMRDRELQHEVANKEAISGAAIDIPAIDRKKPKKATAEEKEDYSKLFENYSDSEDETRFMLKEERPDQAGKKKNIDSETDSDDYSDFDDEELEQLAQSASSSDDEEEEQEDIPKKMAQSKKFTPQKPTISHKSLSKENGADEEDVVEDFALSDFDSD